MNRARRRRVLFALAAVVVLAVAGAVIWHGGTGLGSSADANQKLGSSTAPGPTSTSLPSSASSTPTCAPSVASTQVVKLAVASGIAPVISQVAASACIPVKLTVTDTASGAALLRSGAVAAWIPDSSHRAAAGGLAVRSSWVSVARSPIVAQATSAVAGEVQAAGGFSWGSLLAPSLPGGLSVALAPAATSSTVFVLAERMASVAIAATHDRYLGLAATAGAIGRFKTLSGAELTSAPAPQQIRIVEQRLTRAASTESVTTIDTGNGLPALDYPWVPAPGGAPSAAASRLLSAVRGPAGHSARAAAGFLDPGATSTKIGTETTTLAGPVSAADIPTDLLLANLIPVRGRALAIVDISGSMGDSDAAGDPTPMDVVKASVPYVLDAVTPDTKLELWEFGSRLDGDQDYRVLLPMETLADHRAEVNSIISGIHSESTGTGLYNTVLAGYREIQQNFDPDGGNILAVFTDGTNQDAPGLDLPGLLTQLGQLADPSKPVSVLLFGYGHADIPALTAIAGAVRGQVLPIVQPEQMAGALISAVSQTVSAGLT